MSAQMHASLPIPFLVPRSLPATSRTHRVVVGSTIVFGLSVVLYLALSGELFRPAREAFAAGA